MPDAHTLPTGLPVDPAEMVHKAAEVLDSFTGDFVAGVGSQGTHTKESKNDFATDVDLLLEKRISNKLREISDLEVHGEEYGGPPVHEGTLWVVDPIDGTANYSFGVPMTGMMLALIHEGQVVLGLTWLPQLDLRFTSVLGSPLREGGEDVPRITDTSIRDAAVGLGSLNTGSRTTFPPAYRREVFEELTVRSARTRKFGSTGVDLSFVASSRLAAAVSFGNFAWDNAAGACHVRCAGGVVTDLAGEDWNVSSDSILAATPTAHAEVVTMLRELGSPASYHEADRRRPTKEPEKARPWLEDGR